MAYNAIAQREHHDSSDDESPIASVRPGGATDHDDNAHKSIDEQRHHATESRPESRESFASAQQDHLSEKSKSSASKSTRYDLLEEEDYEEPMPVVPGDESASHKKEPESKGSDCNNDSLLEGKENEEQKKQQQHEESLPEAESVENLASMASNSSSPEPTMTIRTYSSEGSMSRKHPKPGLQSIQGAYTGNVERLELSAERLSMGSDIGEELRKLREEERKSGSRRSSMQDLQTDEGTFNGPSFRRQFSSGSISSSIVGVNNVARHGGYSSSAFVTSPKGSIRSGSSTHFSHAGRPTSRDSRLAHLPEPELEGRPLDSIVASPRVKSLRSAASIHSPSYIDQEHVRPLSQTEETAEQDQNPPGDHPERPASTDTYQQARTLFTDFDGVHYPEESQSRSTSGHLGPTSRATSFNRNSRPMSFLEPVPGENMVYYPAPVPEILNLPKRLSKLPSMPGQEKRRSHFPPIDATNLRRSMSWFPGISEGAESNHGELEEGEHEGRLGVSNRRSTANFDRLPPQLRASVFFDQPSIEHDIAIRGGSAVDTLESILDASATAPVNAFLDHPIAGRVGKEVYGKERLSQSSADLVGRHLEVPKSRQSANVLRKRNSAGNLEVVQRREGNRFSLASSEALPEGARQSVLSEAELAAQQDDTTLLEHSRRPISTLDEEGALTGEDEVDEGQLDDEFFGPPTTLLAELQLRKKQQRQRNLTAATAFPNGMRSTLLELDAVAQLQKNSRQQKRITLAWERPEATEGDNIDDEVPLGVLFPGKDTLMNKYNTMSGADRPLGLMEKRDLEDNEPLSRRRERLRGGSRPVRDASPHPRASTMFHVNVADDKDPDEPEGETLGQRMKRMRTKSQLFNESGDKPINSEIASGDFTSEIMNELGLGEANKAKDGAESGENKQEADEPEEETLGQRKKRLLAEQESRSREVSNGSGTSPKPRLHTTRSMADILQAYPVPVKRSASQDRLSTMMRTGRSASQDRLSSMMLKPGQRSSSHDRLSTMLATSPGSGGQAQTRPPRQSMYPPGPMTPGQPFNNQYALAAFNNNTPMQNYAPGAAMSSYQLGSPSPFFSPTLGMNMNIPYGNGAGTGFGGVGAPGSYFPAPMAPQYQSQYPMGANMNMNQSMMFQPNMFNQRTSMSPSYGIGTGLGYNGGGGYPGMARNANPSLMSMNMMTTQLPQLPSMQRDRIDAWRQSVLH